MRITVIVTPEEHAKIKRAAGLASLSSWIRHVALACSEADGYNPSVLTSKWKEFQRFLTPVYPKKGKK